jgi:type IV secretion system protein TrbG
MNHLYNLLALVLAASPVLLAQQSVSAPAGGKAPPVEVKRQAPGAVPAPERYPFGRLIDLAVEDPLAGAAAGSDHGAGGRIGDAGIEDVPPGYQPVKDIALPPMARQALTVSQSWMAEKHAPAAGKDGRVLYTYGAGLATVVCAPLRICVIELEPGEKIVGEPQIGDSVRWIISPASAGRGSQETSMVVVKPKQPGLDTSLLVTTDRRAYYLRLVSKPEDFLARVAFAYPEDEVNRWTAHLEEQDRRRKEEFEAARISPVESLDNLYFDYRIVGGDENMRPVRVVDDGRKTYVQMTPNAAHREAPVLVVLGPQGPEMVNYRVKGDMYIVDRLFERGALILGVGKKARKAEIVRGTYRGKVKGDPYTRFSKPSKEKRP